MELSNFKIIKIDKDQIPVMHMKCIMMIKPQSIQFYYGWRGIFSSICNNGKS